MSPQASNDTIAEQIKNLSSSVEKIDRQLDMVSQSMSQFIEFRKEAEFLNEKMRKLESSRNKILDDLRDLSLSVNSQKTLNRILQVIIGIAASAGLSIGLVMYGASGKTDSQINSMDKDISLIKFQLTQITKQPSVQVNNNDEKKN